MAKHYTEEEFLNLVKQRNPTLEVLGTFINTSEKILFRCPHSERESYAWELLKPRKFCCHQEYHAQRVPAQLMDLETRKLKVKEIFKEQVDVTNMRYSTDRRKLDGLVCRAHSNLGEFSQWIGAINKGIGCPQCGAERKKAAGIRMLTVGRQKQLDRGKAKFVSKSETIWLNELGVSDRQVWLNDVQYRVDGFDQDSNTVYLYHGQFWHGCPNTFDPEMIHPILKVKMKQLYEQTMQWEQKIREAGYNLITKWGK